MKKFMAKIRASFGRWSFLISLKIEK